MVRDSAAGLEVFMVKRHEGMDYLGDALVFPGGRVDKADMALAQQHESFGLSHDEMQYRIAAVRETFEEAGILFARPAGSADLISAARLAKLEDARKEIHANAEKLGELLAREKLVLALDLLLPYARWITPTPAPKRFDTHFFLVGAAPDQVALHDGHESVDSLWISPKVALDEVVARKRRIAFPTRMNLQPLLKLRNVAEALASVRGVPVRAVEPQFDAKTRTSSVPADAGYGPDVLGGEVGV
jgi:8-oxo-dGTP pyrophosphatase MutT (NUDIX family)